MSEFPENVVERLASAIASRSGYDPNEYDPSRWPAFTRRFQQEARDTLSEILEDDYVVIKRNVYKAVTDYVKFFFARKNESLYQAEKRREHFSAELINAVMEAEKDGTRS